MDYINEIYRMDDIFDFERSIAAETGIVPFNVSHWNSSKKYNDQLYTLLDIPAQAVVFDYIYSYSISKADRRRLIQMLCEQGSEQLMTLIVQSSTIAILNVVNLLKYLQIQKLCVLKPFYFSVASCCDSLGINYDYEYLELQHGQPLIPFDRILSNSYDAVWITSPMFCTGNSFDNIQVGHLLYLLQAGKYVIIDESLVPSGQELLRVLPVSHYLINIYSPHKSLAVNNIKFAAILCDVMYEDFLEQWVDVFSGGLSMSNYDAVYHYMSANFLVCDKYHTNYVCSNIKRLLQVTREFDVEILHEPPSHYASIRLRKTRGIDSIATVSSVIKSTYCSYIPGSLTGLDEYYGDTFRVNLTLSSDELYGAVGLILSYLNA